MAPHSCDHVMIMNGPFLWNYKNIPFLGDDQADGIPAYIAILVVLFIVSALVPLLQHTIQVLRLRAAALLRTDAPYVNTEGSLNTPFLVKRREGLPGAYYHYGVVVAVLYAIQFLVAYLLMLVAMTYIAPYLITIVVGAATGFFFIFIYGNHLVAGSSDIGPGCGH